MRFDLILLIITMFTTLSLINSFSQSNLILNKYEEELPQKNYFELSNETKTIFDTTIYDASLNLTAFVFSNVTDSGLIITFGLVKTTLHSNESFLREKIFDHEIIFNLYSKGNSTGYYWIRSHYCRSNYRPANGNVNDLHFLEIIIIFSVISIILRRNKSNKIL
jgi:hypothetical protein